MLFKIRSSACSAIMGGSMTKPTEKQLARIDELQNKPKRTDKQEQELTDLIHKRDSKPNLQQGAKTYCEQWLKEQLYNRQYGFSSKYTEKGIECEQAGIDMVADRMGYGMIVKNDQYFEDNHITGTPDLILSDTVEDVKCPWAFHTFPLFDAVLPNPDYYWQMQCYMALTGKPSAAVNYCLIDTPEFIIDREARNTSYKAGLEEVEMELYDEVYRKLTYSDVPYELRFKRFMVERNESAIQAIRQQVELCRVYIHDLLVNNSIVTLK